jgi:drug/metabolite transporter (DMT)-like permease
MSVALALAAALCYALGAALQHAVAATREESSAAGFIAALFRRRAWLFGNAMNAAGWAFQAAALGRGELVLVQPLLLLSVVLSLPMTAWVRGERPDRRAWMGSLCLLVGVVAFVVGSRPQGAGRAASWVGWGGTGAVVAVLAGGAILCGRLRPGVRATLWAVAAGLLFGLAAALTKATVDEGSAFLVHWPVYALVGVTGLAFYWMQRAYQSGPLAASFPVIIALDPVVSVALGVLLFGERVDPGLPWLVLDAVGVAITLLGIATLATSRVLQRAD